MVHVASVDLIGAVIPKILTNNRNWNPPSLINLGGYRSRLDIKINVVNPTSNNKPPKSPEMGYTNHLLVSLSHWDALGLPQSTTIYVNVKIKLWLIMIFGGLWTDIYIYIVYTLNSILGLYRLYKFIKVYIALYRSCLSLKIIYQWCFVSSCSLQKKRASHAPGRSLFSETSRCNKRCTKISRASAACTGRTLWNMCCRLNG